jgi:hypothetical protein
MHLLARPCAYTHVLRYCQCHSLTYHGPSACLMSHSTRAAKLPSSKVIASPFARVMAARLHRTRIRKRRSRTQREKRARSLAYNGSLPIVGNIWRKVRQLCRALLRCASPDRPDEPRRIAPKVGDAIQSKRPLCTFIRGDEDPRGPARIDRGDHPDIELGSPRARRPARRRASSRGRRGTFRRALPSRLARTRACRKFGRTRK